MAKDKKRRRRGRPRTLAMPEQIDARPEDLARAFLTSKPRRPENWRFLREHEGLDTKDLSD